MNRIPPACLTNANQDRKAHWKSCTPAIQKTMGLEREERKRALAASQRNNDPSMVTSTHSIGFHNTRGGHANDAYAHMQMRNRLIERGDVWFTCESNPTSTSIIEWKAANADPNATYQGSPLDRKNTSRPRCGNYYVD